MQIDLNAELTLADTHPIARELTKEERSIYQSALQQIVDTAVEMADLKEEGRKSEGNSSEMVEIEDRFFDAIAIRILFEELGTRRRENGPIEVHLRCDCHIPDGCGTLADGSNSRKSLND